MSGSIFDDRKNSFAEGFFDFFDGQLVNPYSDQSDEDFLNNREWQHGFDRAYLLNQAAVEEHEKWQAEQLLNILQVA